MYGPIPMHYIIIQLLCIDRFGAGFTLQAKVGLKSSSTEESEGNSPSRSSATADSDAYNTESLDAFITEEFPGAVLWEKHQVRCSIVIIEHTYARHNEGYSGNSSVCTHKHAHTHTHTHSHSHTHTHTHTQGAVTYQLPSGAVSWSAVFRLLEENKERLGIVDYSVSQTTLEQVHTHIIT